MPKREEALRGLYEYCPGLADFVLAANRHGYTDNEIIDFIAKLKPVYDIGFQDFRPGDMKG